MERLFVNTQSHTELFELTRDLKVLIARNSFKDGVAHLFSPQSTAALTFSDSASLDVQYDLLCALNVAVPWMQPHFRNPQGNSAAHVKAGMMGHCAALFVVNGELMLGQDQGIFLCEFDGPKQRQIWVQLESSKSTGGKFDRSNPL